ncbi:MAG: hypothetical protein AB1439_08845 [candidate division FCPU426 bacterium]
MDLQPDFKELLALFNVHKVEYLIVGGYALAYHGAPRMTGDMDILIKPDVKNAGRILKALTAFGFKSLNFKPRDFSAPGQVIQLGVPPVRVDLLTSLTGVSWKAAAAGSVSGTYGRLSVRFLGRKQFIANKRAVGRKRDLADLEALGEE